MLEGACWFKSVLTACKASSFEGSEAEVDSAMARRRSSGVVADMLNGCVGGSFARILCNR